MTEKLDECKSIGSTGIHLKMQVELANVIVAHHLREVTAVGGAS